MILKLDAEKTDKIKKELKMYFHCQVVFIALSAKIQFADALPKTRFGKIMHRILKRITADMVDKLDDTTTLADPTVVETLVKERIK